MLQFWEEMEFGATVFGAVFFVAGASLVFHTSYTKSRNSRLGRTDRLVGGIVVALFGATLLWAK